MSGNGRDDSVKTQPLFEVVFATQDGERTLNELLPADKFDMAREKAVRIAEERGWIVMGIIQSPWKVITEFGVFVV